MASINICIWHSNEPKTIVGFCIWCRVYTIYRAYRCPTITFRILPNPNNNNHIQRCVIFHSFVCMGCVNPSFRFVQYTCAPMCRPIYDLCIRVVHVFVEWIVVLLCFSIQFNNIENLHSTICLRKVDNHFSLPPQQWTISGTEPN